MDYKNGKIYTIRSHQTDKFYIGSTTQPLSKRLSAHKANYKNYLDGKYQKVTSFDIIEYGDAYIELLDECPCETKDQLLKREGKFIRAEPNCVNKCVAGRTLKEYYADNTDKIKEIKKEYREKNAEKIKDSSKQYYADNQDKIKENSKTYREQNAEKLKEYRLQNADKKNEYVKQYREQNADKIKQYIEKNADKIKARQKQYREKNADKMKEYREQNADEIKEYQKQYRENKKKMEQQDI